MWVEDYVGEVVFCEILWYLEGGAVEDGSAHRDWGGVGPAEDVLVLVMEESVLWWR